MGGGDREKKWKLEEMDKSERRRLKELLKERLKGKPEEDEGVPEQGKTPLDWMYNAPGNQVNREDYLVGKEVDKTFIDAQDGPKDTVGGQGGVASAGAVFGSSASTAMDTKDMARKMREDPLFAIKKRELNSRKELVSNPIRMKQLQQMLQSQVGKDKKKSKKAKKQKEKKTKKHRRSRDTSSETSSEDERLAGHPRGRPPLQKAERRKHGHSRQGGGRERLRPSSSSSSSSSSDSDQAPSRHRGGSRDIASLNAAKMKALLEREMLKKKRRPKESSSPSGSDSEDERRRKKVIKKHLDDRSRSKHLGSEQQERFRLHADQSSSHKRRKDRSVSPPVRRRRDEGGQHQGTRKGYGLHGGGGRSSRHSRTPSPSEGTSRHDRDERSGGVSPHRGRHRELVHMKKVPDRRRDARSSPPGYEQSERHGSRTSDGREEKRRPRERSNSPSPLRQHGGTGDRHWRSRSRSPARQNGGQRPATTKRKLTAEEMERKRMEMMDNAKWRDDQRRERVKEYEKEEEAEAEMEKKKSRNAEFVQPLKLPENSSVEDRIHRKIHSIQRTKAALDKNFAKR